MKPGLCFLTCIIWGIGVGVPTLSLANGFPHLVLDISGPGGTPDPYFAAPGEVVMLTVNRDNQVAGLGGLAYDLNFSESLDLTRNYSGSGWIANDGLFDNSTPLKGVAFNGTGIGLDTVKESFDEFPVGTSGSVEVLTITLPVNPTERWIFFDLVNPSASNSAGSDWVTGLGGDIIVGSVDVPGYNNPPHTYAIYVPEPATLSLLAVGISLAVRRRRKQ